MAADRRTELGDLRLMIQHEAAVVPAAILQSNLWVFNEDSISYGNSD